MEPQNPFDPRTDEQARKNADASTPSFIDAFAAANEMAVRHGGIFSFFVLLSLATHFLGQAEKARGNGLLWIKSLEVEIFAVTAALLLGWTMTFALYRTYSLAQEKGKFTVRDFCDAIPAMSIKALGFAPILAIMAGTFTLLLLFQSALGVLAQIPMAILLAVTVFLSTFYLVLSAMRPAMNWKEIIRAALAYMKYGNYFGFALLLFMYTVPGLLAEEIGDKLWPYLQTNPSLYWGATALIAVFTAYLNFAGTGAQVLYLKPRMQTFLGQAIPRPDSAEPPKDK